MKIEDLEEHFNLPPIPGSWLSPTLLKQFSKGRSVGQLKMNYGTFDVLERKIKNTVCYAVIQNNVMLCFVELIKDPLHSNIWILNKLERNKTQKTDDMPSALFHFLVLDKNKILRSSNEMTAQGTNFWKSLVSRGQISIGLFDNKLNKIYQVNEGIATTDGFLTVLPENDRFNRDYTSLTSIPATFVHRVEPRYRFFYITIKDAKISDSHILHHLIKESPEYEWAFLFGSGQELDYSEE